MINILLAQDYRHHLLSVHSTSCCPTDTKRSAVDEQPLVEATVRQEALQRYSHASFKSHGTVWALRT